MQNLKNNIFNENKLGIYRDDALAVIQSNSPRTTDNTTKALNKIFNNWDFKITIDAGLIQTNV